MNGVDLSARVAQRYELEEPDMLLPRPSSSTPKPREMDSAAGWRDIPIEESGNNAMGFQESDPSSYSSPESITGESNNLGSLQETEALTRTPYREPVRILIVGPSGSGKTCTIANWHYGTIEPTDSDSYRATKHTEAIYLDFEGQTFELIDTPGFDNVHMSDAEAFVDAANYLLNPERVQIGITGIIYFHRAGNPVRNRSLIRNIRVLENIFLGEAGTSRLTFLVTQSATHGVDFDGLIDQMAARGSAFSTVFSGGAQFATFPNEIGLAQLLRFYASQTPIMLPIQLGDSQKSHSTLVNRIEDELGYYESDSVKLLLDNQEQQLEQRYRQMLANHDQLEAQLRQQLHQSQSEYSSLRSQLQLQENVEQSQVVQALKDINRMIEDIARTVSAYFADNHVQSTFGRDASSVSALHSHDLSALTKLFCHHDGKSSLIASSTGKGAQIEDFLDYSIRNFLCRFLFLRIFRPFHPQINPTLSKTLLASYDNIQKRESQAIAGKWRSETFKSLREVGGHDPTEAEINQHLCHLSNRLLEPLIKGVFGKDIPLEDVHKASLRSLIKMAWSWNSQLKGGVIMLGDFIQTYSPRSRFDSTWMEEFEATSQDQQPTFILGTLALGLLCRRAAGRGNPVEETVVCKAVVITKNIFS